MLVCMAVHGGVMEKNSSGTVLALHTAEQNQACLLAIRSPHQYCGDTMSSCWHIAEQNQACLLAIDINVVATP